MTLATEVKKLRDTKAFYAVAGASDLAVATLRTVPERINRLQEKTDLNDLQTRAGHLQTRAKEYAATVTGKATELYDELAERGRDVVTRTAEATKEPVAEVEAAATTTKRQVKGAGTTAKKATKAAGETASKAADKAGR